MLLQIVEEEQTIKNQIQKMADIPVAIVLPVPPLPQGFINPERAGFVRVIPAQAAALRALFLSKQAENMDSRTRNLFFRNLILEPAFANLNISHLRYQWAKYHAEYVLRNRLGLSFAQASRTMPS